MLAQCSILRGHSAAELQLFPPVVPPAHILLPVSALLAQPSMPTAPPAHTPPVYPLAITAAPTTTLILMPALPASTSAVFVLMEPLAQHANQGITTLEVPVLLVLQ